MMTSIVQWMSLIVCATVVQMDAPVSSPIELSGFSASQIDQVEDGSAFSFDSEILSRLMFRAGKVSKANFEKYGKSTADVALEQVVSKPRKYRFQVFQVSGRAIKVKRFRSVGNDSRYVVEVKTPSGQMVKVAVGLVPSVWHTTQTIDEPVEAIGFLYGTVADGETTKLLIASKQLVWRPTQPNAEMGIGAAQVLLAEKGVDVGSLDSARRQNTLPLSVIDSECFYQFLAAANKTLSNEMPAPSADFLKLMQNPKGHFGDSVVVSGRVRRCIPVQVDEFVSSQIGIGTYYELDMFVQLGEQTINVRTSEDQTLEYRHRFPITVCTTDLGEGRSPADVQDQMVEVNGFFYRFWKYKSEFTDRPDGTGGQVSPLIIGLAPTLISSPGSSVDRLLTFAIIGLLVGGSILLWIFRPNRDSSSTVEALPDKPDFSGISDK